MRQVRAERPVPHKQLKIVKCGEPLEPRFFASLIEDRTVGLQSTYTEFLQRMGYRPQSQNPPGQGQQQMGAPPGAGGPPGGMPGGAPGGAPMMGGGAPPMGGGMPMGAMAPPTMMRR